MGNFSALFLLNFFVYLNNVESLLISDKGLIKNTVAGVFSPISSSANCSLLTFGTTSCSSYPHVSVSQENLGIPCFTQLYFSYTGSFGTKCRCQRSETGVGVVYINIPINPLPVVNCPVTPGYIFIDSILKNDSSTHVTSKTAYIQLQTGERISIFTSKQDATTGIMTVFPYATTKGFVQLVCNIKNLSAPVCSAINYLFVCTYERNAPAEDIEALVTPLKVYPYFSGNNLFVMDQQNCDEPILDGGISDAIDLVQSPGALTNALQNKNPPPDVTKVVGGVGTTVCSNFPKINQTIKNFQTLCYIQKDTPAQNQESMSCKTKKFTVNSPGVDINVDILKGTTLMNGTSVVTYKIASGGSGRDENTFVETATAVVVLMSLNKSSSILRETQAIVSYTDKGYSFISCNMSDPKRQLCTGITYAGVCTYARIETEDAINALMEPFNKSPYFIGGSFVSVDQTNYC